MLQCLIVGLHCFFNKMHSIVTATTAFDNNNILQLESISQKNQNKRSEQKQHGLNTAGTQFMRETERGAGLPLNSLSNYSSLAHPRSKTLQVPL